MKKNFDVVFMGGKQAGCIGLLTLLALGHKVPLVIAYDPILADLAHFLKLPLGDSIKNQAELLSKSDLLISVHGREIVPNELLSLPKLGCINLHPCLWKYKGTHPVERMLADGEDYASVGSHYMTDKVDEGEVIVEGFCNVKGATTPVEVYNYLYPIYTCILADTLQKIRGKH